MQSFLLLIIKHYEFGHKIKDWVFKYIIIHKYILKRSKDVESCQITDIFISWMETVFGLLHVCDVS